MVCGSMCIKSYTRLTPGEPPRKALRPTRTTRFSYRAKLAPRALAARRLRVKISRVTPRVSEATRVRASSGRSAAGDATVVAIAPVAVPTLLADAPIPRDPRAEDPVFEAPGPSSPGKTPRITGPPT